MLWSLAGGFQALEAVRELRDANRLDGTVGLAELAPLYAHLGLERLSRQALARALEFDPTGTWAAHNAVDALEVLGLFHESTLEYRRLCNRPGRNAALLLVEPGRDTAALIRGAYDRRPSPVTHADYALLAATEGHFAEAEREIPFVIGSPRTRSIRPESPLCPHSNPSGISTIPRCRENPLDSLSAGMWRVSGLSDTPVH
ncbi:MAG: hypothetical protein QOJ99_4094 [Bryobacterales bacterium]|jgi:hypothetical protein|nr:hypothetical protein [Bryobacterales bacterium]